MFRWLIDILHSFGPSRSEQLAPEHLIVVRSDADRIEVAYPDGTVQSIEWTAVKCVAIETNDSGPIGADVWWLLEGTGARVAYPMGATGEQEMLSIYPDHLPGFNHEAVIAAMTSIDNARFVCWERSS